MQKLRRLTIIFIALVFTAVIVWPAQAQAQCYAWFAPDCDCREVACPVAGEPENITDWVGTSCATAPKLPECDLSPTDEITKSDFDAFNPLKIGNNGGTSPYADQLSTPGGIVSRLLEFAFPIAGMILFVTLLWGGFEMIYGASTASKAVEAGKNRITAAIIGFFLLFASYWMVQILEVILGIKIF